MILNIKEALKYMDDNEALYHKTLKMFYESYNGADLKQNHDKVYIHTLKGLSLNIGANKLNSLLVSFEDNGDLALLDNIMSEMNLVINEIEDILSQNNQEEIEKEDISSECIQELFKELEKVLPSRRPQKINFVMDEIKKYKLEARQDGIFQEVEKYVSKYNFQKAISVLKGEL